MKRSISSMMLLATLLLSPAVLYSSSQKFFYRAGPYETEPRFERNCLSTFKADVWGGTSKKGYNGSGDSTDILNIYGYADAQAWAVGGVLDPASSQYNADLAALLIAPPNPSGTFAQLKYTGKFTFIQGDLYWAQNFSKGFFFDINLPIQRLTMEDIGYVDETSASNAGSVAWRTVKANLDDIYAQYGLSAGTYKHTGLGDMRIMGGWTINHEDMQNIDFFDATIKIGVSIPTAKKKSISQIFSVPGGYNGHVGVPITFDMALGMYEWFTFGAHIEGMFFNKKTQAMSMYTSTQQSGPVKLLSGQAKVDMGSLWDIGVYAKADHIFKGLSFLFGYTYSSKGSDTLTPENTAIFPTAAVNSDPSLQGWKRQDINIRAEYDFAQEGRRYNPIIGVCYNMPVAGKYIFKTWTVGGDVAVNVTWDF